MVIPRCFGTTTTLPPAKSRQKLTGTSSRNVLLFHNDENNDGRGSALHAGQWLRIDANRRRPSENCPTEALRSTGRSLFESIILGAGYLFVWVGLFLHSHGWKGNHALHLVSLHTGFDLFVRPEILDCPWLDGGSLVYARRRLHPAFLILPDR